MPKVVKVLVKPLLGDKYENLTIDDVIDRDTLTPQIRQLIKSDVTCRICDGCSGTFQTYSTKFGGNHKVYMLNGIVYDVNFAFPLRR